MVESVKSPSAEQLDVIKKPRTNYSSNILRCVLPNVNIQQKMESLTMMKLKVLTTMKLNGREDSVMMMPRKVKTVQQIPKILTIMGHPRAGENDGFKSGIHAIQEEEDVSRPGDDSSSGADTPSDEEEDSSIDGDFDDEERMYQ